MNDSTLDTIVKASRPVRYAATAALGILALFLLALALNAWMDVGRSSVPVTNTITVTGEGKSTATPDIATIDFSVMQTAASVADAQAAATAKTNAALDAVKKLGVADADVKTTGYQVYPQYAAVPPCYSGACPVQSSKITGYQVSQSVEVKVRDTLKAGDVLQALGTLGVENISGPNFAVDDDNGVKNDARAAAIANARAKASELAKELGVSLGKVVSYSENGGPYPVFNKAYAGGVAMDMQSAPAPSLPVGTNETDVTVSVTYEIH